MFYLYSSCFFVVKFLYPLILIHSFVRENDKQSRLFSHRHPLNEGGSQFLRSPKLSNCTENKTIDSLNILKSIKCIEDCPRNERPLTTRTPALRSMVKKKIQSNSQRNIQKLANKHNVDGEFICRLVKDYLQLVPY